MEPSIRQRIRDGLAWRMRPVTRYVSRYRPVFIVQNYHRLFRDTLATDFDEGVFGGISQEYFRRQLAHLARDYDVLTVRAAIPDFVREVFAVDGRQLLTQRGDEIGAHGHYSESMERVKDGLPESTVRAAANCCCKAGGQFVKRDSETDNLMSR